MILRGVGISLDGEVCGTLAITQGEAHMGAPS
jgi:hypothetical protein